MREMPHAMLYASMAGSNRERRGNWMRRARDYKRLDPSGTMVATCVRHARSANHSYLQYMRTAREAYADAIRDERDEAFNNGWQEGGQT